MNKKLFLKLIVLGICIGVLFVQAYSETLFGHVGEDIKGKVGDQTVDLQHMIDSNKISVAQSSVCGGDFCIRGFDSSGDPICQFTDPILAWGQCVGTPNPTSCGRGSQGFPRDKQSCINMDWECSIIEGGLGEASGNSESAIEVGGAICPEGLMTEFLTDYVMPEVPKGGTNDLGKSRWRRVSGTITNTFICLRPSSSYSFEQKDNSFTDSDSATNTTNATIENIENTLEDMYAELETTFANLNSTNLGEFNQTLIELVDFLDSQDLSSEIQEQISAFRAEIQSAQTVENYTDIYTEILELREDEQDEPI